VNKKILVSGCSGFVGSNLLSYLHLKFDLFGLYRENKKAPYLKGTYLWKDLSVKDLQGINSIVHLAGKAHDVKKNLDAEEYLEINTNLTKLFFDIFLQSTASVFIYVSSVKAVADTVDGILTENHIPNPKTPYGQSKHLAEEYILNSVIPKDKRVFILRPCMIHGPGNKGNLNLLYKFVKQGIPYPLAAFNNKRSFLSISNLNFIIEKLINDPDVPGGIYNIADDDALSTNQIIKIIAQAGSFKIRLWKLNPSIIKLVASTGDVLHLPLNTERLKKLTENYVVSNEKIKKALGIKDLPMSSTNGLINTIQSFN